MVKESTTANDGDGTLPGDTLRAVIERAAQSRPERMFLIAPELDRRIDYAELQGRVADVARRLTALGLKKGEPVSFMLGNGSATVELLLGSMYGGYLASPLNTAAGQSQLEYVLEHSETKNVFVSSQYQVQLDLALAKINRAVRVIPTDVDTGPSWPQPTRDNTELDELNAQDNALLMYTSGTTGNPKGVLLTHRNILSGGMNTVLAHQLTRKDRGLCVLPLSHINAQIVTVFGPLLSGGSVVMPHRFSVSRFWEWVTRHGCTWFSVVPTIIAYLLHDPVTLDKDKAQALDGVRFGRSASAPLPPALHRQFQERFGIPIVETMGLTETSAQILSNPMPPAQGKIGSPGVPFGNEVKIFDGSSKELGPNEQGEIVVRGPNVMSGYLKDPVATQSALKAGGWLHTGDLGQKDDEGFVFVTGRLKELIIKGGENISPREIDDILYSHPAVIEAGTVGVADDHYGEEVIACVVAKDDVPCEEQELIDYCADKVGGFKAPRAIYFMSDLPKGPSGKVQRRKLLALIEGGFPTSLQKES